jgi:hypothetical protein
VTTEGAKPSPGSELDCAGDLRIAIAHIEAGTGKFGLTLLSKYANCHITHETCPCRGEDCAIPELLEGFYIDSQIKRG